MLLSQGEGFDPYKSKKEEETRKGIIHRQNDPTFYKM